MSAPDVAGVAARLAEVRARIAAAGGDAASVRVVAVTKGFGPEAVEAAVGAGLTDVGENYAQELLAKAQALAGLVPAPRWHAIGRLQRNKVRLLAGTVSCWQSVDRLELGVEIARRAPGAKVLVQVSAWGEVGKGGVPLDEVAPLVEQLVSLGLRVDGLMAVAPVGGGAVAERGFAQVREAADRLGLRDCSMGMSGDLEEAIRAGSTMVRVGTALLGPRGTGPVLRN